MCSGVTCIEKVARAGLVGATETLAPMKVEDMVVGIERCAEDMVDAPASVGRRPCRTPAAGLWMICMVRIVTTENS